MNFTHVQGGRWSAAQLKGFWDGWRRAEVSRSSPGLVSTALRGAVFRFGLPCDHAVRVPAVQVVLEREGGVRTFLLCSVSLRRLWKKLLRFQGEGELDPEDVVLAPFALENLDMISTSPLYLAVSRPGCVSPRWLFEEFHHFLREGVLGSRSTFRDHAATSSSSGPRLRRCLRSVYRWCSLCASEWVLAHFAAFLDSVHPEKIFLISRWPTAVGCQGLRGDGDAGSLTPRCSATQIRCICSRSVLKQRPHHHYKHPHNTTTTLPSGRGGRGKIGGRSFPRFEFVSQPIPVFFHFRFTRWLWTCFCDLFWPFPSCVWVSLVVAWFDSGYQPMRQLRSLHIVLHPFPT